LKFGGINRKIGGIPSKFGGINGSLGGIPLQIGGIAPNNSAGHPRSEKFRGIPKTPAESSKNQ